MKLSFDSIINGNTTVWNINERNRLLIQKKRINFDEKQLNKINFKIEGNGTGLFQVKFYSTYWFNFTIIFFYLIKLIVKYNLAKENPIKNKADFEFSLFSSKSYFGSECDYSMLTINAKYIGENNQTGMIITSVKLPSGWTSLEETIELLKTKVELKRYEISNENRLFLYFDQVFWIIIILLLKLKFSFFV